MCLYFVALDPLELSEHNRGNISYVVCFADPSNLVLQRLQWKATHEDEGGHGGCRSCFFNRAWVQTRRSSSQSSPRHRAECKRKAVTTHQRSRGGPQSSQILAVGGPGTKLLLRLPKQAKASRCKGFRAWHRCAGDVKTAAPTHTHTHKMRGDQARPGCRDDGLRRRVHLDIAEDRLA